MTKTTDQNPVEESFELEAEEIARGNIKLLPLGHRPYVLIRPTFAGNEGYRIAKQQATVTHTQSTEPGREQ